MSESLPRVVEWVRVSTQGQADRDTPELQRRELDRMRSTMPTSLPIVERIEELGVSGALPVAQRAGLRRLEQLSAAKAFDQLRVYAIDRLTRAESAGERFVVWGLVEAAGAVIVDARGQVLDPKDDVGEMGYYLQTYAAAKERQKILERTSAGRRKAAELGRLPSGKPPFGRRYDRAAHAWVLVPDQVDLYRRIIKMALAGQSARDIVAALNASGATTARGGAWSKSSLLLLLQSESIVGRWHTCGQLIQVPPILDEVAWARLRAALAGRGSQTGPRPTIEALLRGMLFCSGCDTRAYVVPSGTGRTRRHRYACATDSRTAHGCKTDRFGIRVTTADAAVRAALLGALSHPKVLRAAVVAGRSRFQAVSTRTDYARAEADLAKLARQQAQVLRLLGEEMFSEAVARERLSAIRTQTAEAEQRRRTLAPPLDAPSPGEHGVDEAAAQLASDIADATAAEFRALLGIIIPRRAPYGLRLYRDRIELVGRLPLLPDALCGKLASLSQSSGQFAFVPLCLSVPLRRAS